MPPQPASDRFAITVNSGFGGGVGRDIRLRPQSGDGAEHGDPPRLARHQLCDIQTAGRRIMRLLVGAKKVKLRGTRPGIKINYTMGHPIT